MTAKWLPVEGGIVPRAGSSGPTQAEERFAAMQGELEKARGEYRLRRFDVAEAILRKVITAVESSTDRRFNLFAASAYSLQGRIHWRRAERGLEYQNETTAQEERTKQDTSCRKAIELFA